MEPIKLGTMARVTTTPEIKVDALLAIAKERAPDPSVFDGKQPFFWQVRASSNRLDFYDTRMRRTTLDNFARGLADGVSYQDSHNTRKNGWGQSLTGWVVETDETDEEIGERITEVWGELFTLPGLTLGDQSTDSFIEAVRAGIWRDVSVGFYASDIECSICGKQSFEWWKDDGCQHIPGYTYTFEGKEIKAFAWINDGNLVELSQVYKGASPSAAVTKAGQMSQDGRLTEGERAFIERRYGVRLAEPGRIWTPGQARQTSKEQNMLTDINETAKQVIEKALARAVTLGLDVADDTPIGERVTKLVDALERAQADHLAALDTISEGTAALDRATAEIERLRPLADDGKAYRTHLIDDTVAAGARALGKDFREEVYRGILEKLDIAGIRTMKEDFTRQGDALFASNRVTREADEDAGPASTSIDPARHKA